MTKKQISINSKSRNFLALFLISFMSISSYGQIDVYKLMERTDLTLDSVENLANQHFITVGTGKGTGYKQFQRWLYERKFHIDTKGYYILPQVENATYQTFLSGQKKSKSSSLSWTELGPKTWNRTSGWNPGVGRINSIAIHPSDTTKIYIATPAGGIWKSSNSGSSWTPLVDNVNSAWMSLFHICIDPSNQSVIYASLTSGGVIKSSNSGASWTATGSGPSSTRKVLVHPSNSKVLLAAAGNGIWKSTNAGTSWTKVHASAMEDLEFNPYNKNIIYASSPSGTSCVWRSTDGGDSFSAIGSSSGITNTGRTLLAVSDANPAIVYAVQANGSVFGRLYRSSDSGATYSTIITGNSSSGTNFFGYDADGKGTSGQATYDMAICANPKDASEVHIAGIICWKSTNSGTSFVPETEWYLPNSTGYNHADVHALEWVKNSIYSGSDGGIYKSVNKGDDWIDLSSGLGIAQIYKISCAKTDAKMMTMGAQDNGSTYRQSNGSWKSWIGADGMDNAISPTDANFAIGTSQNGYIYRTTDAGSNVTYLNNPSSGNWVTPIVIHPTNHDTIYGGWVGIWRSDDAGDNWTKISGSVITGKLEELVVAPSNPRYIYASIGTTLYRTSDAGKNWSSVTAAASITSICVSPLNPEKIWITCNSATYRVYVSTNMGTSFTNISSGLPNTAARSVTVDDNSWEGVYIGMNIGVYYRDNIDTNWVEHATDLPLVGINEVEIQKSGAKLRVATYGRGIWESPLQTVNPCQAPQSISSSNVQKNSATLNWSSGYGAVSYSIQYKENSSSTWTNSASSTGKSLNITGLSQNTKYDWRIKTKCTGDSSAFIQSTFTTQSNCTAPTGLTVTGISATAATLNWNSSTGAVSYAVEYKANSSSTWIRASNTTGLYLVLSSLSTGITYDWRVKSICSSDSSSVVSSSFTTYACTAPTALSTSNITSSSATLNWSAASSATNYTIEYKLSTSSTWANTKTLSGTSLNLTGLDGGEIYDWRIRSNCSGSNSAFVQGSFTTDCPDITSITISSISSSGATFTWTQPKNSIGYFVSYKTSSSSSWSSSSYITNNNYSLSGLSSGTSYDFRVRSRCSYNIGTNIATTFNTNSSCGSPSSLSISNLTHNSATLNWSSVSSAIYYTVQYKASSSSTWITDTTSTGTNYSLSGLNSGTNYDWQIKANCSGGSSSYVQNNFGTTCITPTGLSAGNITSNSANISWTSASGTTNYTVNLKKSSSSSWTHTYTTSNTYVSLSSLEGGENYVWQVKSNCTSFGSAFASSSFNTTCGDPSNLNVSGITGTAALLNWTSAPGAQNYTIQYKLSSSSTWTGTTTVTDTFLNVSGLGGGNTYDWQVKSTCNVGNGSYKQGSFVTVCSAATNLGSSNISTNTATLSWNTANGANNYLVEYRLKGNSNWPNSKTVTGTTTVLSGLLEGSDYEWHIKTNCTSNKSAFNQAGFTTLCPVTSNLSVSNKNNTSVQLHWKSVGTTTNYTVEYKLNSSSTWAGTTSTTDTFLTLTGLSSGGLYDWRVRTNCSVNTSTYIQSTFTTTCSSPTGLSANSITDSTAVLTWSSVSGVNNYIIEYKQNSSSSWTRIKSTKTSLNLSGLSKATAYQWQVKSICTNDSSSNTSSTFTTSASGCVQPANLSVSNISSTSANLSWTASSGAKGYTLQYKISSSSTWSASISVSGTSYTLTGLSSSTNYDWRINTVCSSSNSNFSSSSFTTNSCVAPSGLAVSNISSSSVTVSWSAVSNINTYTTEYKESSSSTWIGISVSGNTNRSITGLKAGNNYDWRVKSNCGANSSSYSTGSFSTTCPDPSGLSTDSITPHKVYFSWSAISGVDSFNVRYREYPTFNWITKNFGSNIAQIKGLKSGTVYNWRVRSNCILTASTYQTVSFMTICPEPANFGASSITDSSAMVTWSSDSGSINYNLYYKLKSSSNWILATSTSNTGYKLTGLSKNTSYDIQIKGYCSDDSSAYEISSFTTSSSACVYPSNLSETNINTTSAKLNWSAVSGASNYTVDFKPSTSSKWVNLTSTNATSYTVSTLNPGVGYDWRIKTNCTGSSSAYTNSSFSTLCPNIDSLSASNLTVSSAYLSWASIANSVGYTIEYKASNSSSWIGNSNISNTYYNLTGLSSNTTYDFRVRARCNVNNGTYAVIQFTTQSVCQNPTGLYAGKIKTDAANVAWNAITGAGSYLVHYKETSSSTWISAGTTSTAALALNGLNEGTDYDWRVRSNCSTSNSSFVQSSFTTLCPDIDSLQASSISTSGAYLSWVSGLSSNGYTVEYKTSSSSKWIGTTNTSNKYYTLTGLSSGTTYDFRVKANCSANNGTYFNVQFTTQSSCVDPSGLYSAKIKSDAANVVWNQVKGAVSYLVHYKERSSSTWLISGTVTDTFTTITNLIGGRTYDWRVRTNCSGTSSGYTQSGFTTDCDLPANLSSSNISSNSAIISWSSNASARNYLIQFKPKSSSTWSSSITVTGNSYTLTGLNSGIDYDWQVKSVCNANSSAYLGSTFKTNSCLTPNGLSVSNISTSGATLSWNNASGASYYTIEYKISSSSTWVGTSTTTNPTYNLSGLKSGAYYHWRVKTNCGTSSTSYAIDSFLTNCATTNSLKTDSITSNSAHLSWAAVSGIDSFNIQYKESGASWNSNVIGINSYKLLSLKAGTKYLWKVGAKCQSFISSYTLDSFTTNACGTPKNFRELSQTSTSISLAWTSVGSSANYYVEYKSTSSSTWSKTSAITDTTVTLSGLSYGKYDIRLYTKCGSVNSSYSNLSVIIYCKSVSSSTAYEYINYLKIGSIDSKSGNNKGYYFGSSFNTNLKPGNTYSLSFAAGFSGRSWAEFWTFFIDYNQDGDFTDANEQIGQYASSDTSVNSISFTVPNSANLGATRLRAIMAYGYKYLNGCDQVSYGEVEDYPVILTTTPSVKDYTPEITRTYSPKFEVYPVPTKDNLNIAYNFKDLISSGRLIISDLLGQKMYSEIVETTDGTLQETIDISNYKKGIYLISIQTENKIESKKFIILD